MQKEVEEERGEVKRNGVREEGDLWRGEEAPENEEALLVKARLHLLWRRGNIAIFAILRISQFSFHLRHPEVLRIFGLGPHHSKNWSLTKRLFN